MPGKGFLFPFYPQEFLHGFALQQSMARSSEHQCFAPADKPGSLPVRRQYHTLAAGLHSQDIPRSNRERLTESPGQDDATGLVDRDPYLFHTIMECHGGLRMAI